MQRPRASIAQLVWNVALESTANRSRGSPRYLSAFHLASALIQLDMANELPVAVQRLRALKLDSNEYDNACKFFCDISRVSEEVERYQRGLQSARFTIEHARPAIRCINEYLRACRARTADYRKEARSIGVPSRQDTPDLSKSDIQKVHDQLLSYGQRFTELASIFELISETFDEELYHPFLSQHLGDGELQPVGEALDAVNMCLQEIYDEAHTNKAFVEGKMSPYAARLVDMERASGNGKSEGSEVDIRSSDIQKKEAETVPTTCPEEEGDEPVAALRSHLERTLGARASSFRSLASAGTDAPSGTKSPPDQVKPQAETATKANPGAVSAAKGTVQGVRSAPLYAGSVTASFSVVEDVVNRRGNHNRAATLASTSKYMTTEVGMPQLGSVIRTHGRSVPRVFTGSFNELEAGMTRLQIESGSVSAARQPSERDSIIVRDFATPSSTTPGTPASIPPSPATLHYRREALHSREAEVTQYHTARRQQAGDRSTLAGPAEGGPARSDSGKRRRENTI